MRILLANDDGIHAPGLQALASAFQDVAEIVRVAPHDEQSGVGHGISLRRGLQFEDLSDSFQHPAFAVTGTPADCVKFAVTELIREPIDWVISGVNWGTNVGIDVHYSGTVAAATEGAMFGIPAMAVSLERRGPANFAYAAGVARTVFDTFREKLLPDHVVINVNVPGCPPEEIQGIRVLPHSTRGYDERFEQRPDGNGRQCYWLTGDIPNDSSIRNTDILALRQKFITITPLQLDITHYETLSRMSDDAVEETLSRRLFARKEKR